MSDVGPWHRQPETPVEWAAWLHEAERLLWFYPRRGEPQIWTVRRAWVLGIVVGVLPLLLDATTPRDLMDMRGGVYWALAAVSVFSAVMLLLDLVGVRTKPVQQALDRSMVARIDWDRSMRRGSSALTEVRFLHVRGGQLTESRLSQSTEVTGFTLRDNSLPPARKILLRHVGFREEGRLDAALQRARAIRDGREVPA